MKIHNIILTAALMLLPCLMSAQTPPQKREMRSAWVATVWRLDWPNTVITVTGSERQIGKQQNEIDQLLDSLSTNNFNAINFQVRSRSDAMYRSSYESWSADLVETRGMDPGWDPLEYVVEGCHRRGMECHAWVNPYRYESVAHAWDSDPTAWRNTHPEWIMDHDGAAILNPGLPEVTDLICNIIKEIVANYDIDGVLFDDYFYLGGTPYSADAELWNAYRAEGGTLSQADWRRDNVNRMIRSVNNAIKSVKPYVRFGVSPAGIACTSASVAKGHGITACPTGSDWQYNSIFSDPIAWIKNQDIDFISPQIYWTTQAGTNYTIACRWWSDVASRFGRHLYVSHSISSLTPSSKMPAASMNEESIIRRKTIAKASGDGGTTYAEYAKQVMNNRDFCQDGAPGSIFYSAKYLYKQSPKFSHYLRNTVFNTKALVPAMTWIQAPRQEMVTDIVRNGTKLSWQPADGMRYTVYAFPETMPVQNFVREADYLLGVSYRPEYTIPQGQLAGYQYAVCILDRYGNEYTPALLGVPTGTLDAPVLSAPAAAAQIEVPFNFEWQAVDGASEYIVEVSEKADMSVIFDQRSTTATSISTEQFKTLPIYVPLYWRVRSCGASKADGISDIRTMSVTNLLITAPEHQSVNTSLTPTFEYSIPERDVTLDIAVDDNFEEKDIVHSAEGRGSITVPRFALRAAHTYHARMRYRRAGVDMTTPAVQFTTVEMEPVVPTVAYPADGGVLHSNQSIILNDVEGCTVLQVQLASSAAFPARSCYLSPNVDLATMTDNKTAGEIKISSKGLVDGQTYYVRAQSAYRMLDQTTKRSEYGPVVSFTYSAEPAGIDDLNADNAAAAVSVDAGVITALTDIENVCLYDMAGAAVAKAEAKLTAGDTLRPGIAPGIYLLTANTAAGTVNQKIVIK